MATVIHYSLNRRGVIHRLVPRKRWMKAAVLFAPLLLVASLVAVYALSMFSPPARQAPAAAELPSEIAAASQTSQPEPTVGELLGLLSRTVTAPNAVELEIVYQPAMFFEATGRDAPVASSLVFFLQEDTHIDALDATPPRFYVTVDGQGTYYPTSGSILSDSGHHRASQFVFAAESVPAPTRSLTVVIPHADGTTSQVGWQLPLSLTGDAANAPVASSRVVVQDAALSPIELSALNGALRKVRENVVYGGSQAAEFAATYATPDYFRSALSSEAARRYDPDRYAVFMISETAHAADLPKEAPPLTLKYNGQTYTPNLVEAAVSSSHHRVTMVRFPVNPDQAPPLGTMELKLPDGHSLSWSLPIAYQGAKGISPLGISGASILSLVGGMLAAMWPCLFQLTVFFIPALAGLSMEEASGKVGVSSRLRVIKAAGFFILGFTTVYTAAGALIGYVVQQFGSNPEFEQWQRYLGIAGGIAIIILAIRTAARARAPLVCKMPVLSKMANTSKASSPLELMFAGLAFATGCMTCFGAALIIAMVVYVGTAGSALVGASTLFLFSMGMGIPLVIAAAFMARVLPTLTRLERVIPWMGLASSLIMVGFAVLLLTGNYMAFTTWIMSQL